MTSGICGLIFVTGLYPLLVAWRANRQTTLFQAVHWASAAYLTWGIAGAGADLLSESNLQLLRYLALCLTGCAGVAVFGARRPGVGAWNFVLLGLLAVMLLPLAESLLAHGSLHLEGPRTIFLAATLAVIVVNFLPTRLGPAALLLAAGGALQILLLTGWVGSEHAATLGALASVVLAFVPWAAWERLRARPTPLSGFDRVWLDFRDRFGVVWSQRVREQFNNSATHSGWPVVLRWQGLRIVSGGELPGAAEQEAMLTALRALLKRFRIEENET
jgi:hypothetical protein